MRVLRVRALAIGLGAILAVASCGSGSNDAAEATNTSTPPTTAGPDFAAYARYLSVTPTPGTRSLTTSEMPRVYTPSYLASICTSPPAGTKAHPSFATLEAGALAMLDFLCGRDVARSAIDLASGTNKTQHAALVSDLERIEKYRNP